MFRGLVPKECIEQIFRIMNFSGCPSIYVCCSGTLRIEQACRQQYPDMPLFGNDVSLYSVALGKLAAKEVVEFQFTGQLEWLEDVLAGREYIDRVAAVLYAAEIGRYRGQSEHAKKHWKHYKENAELFLAKARASIEKSVASIDLQGFFAGDWRKHVDTCIEQGGALLAFPPFFKGDYEAMWRFVHNNVQWQAPEYDIYDPKMLPEIIEHIDNSGIPYYVISDQVIEGRQPVMKYVHGRKVPHYGYARTPASSVRRIEKVYDPVRFSPCDPDTITENSKLTVAPVDSAFAGYIKDLFLAKGIIHTSGLLNMAVMIDGKLVGVIIYTQMKYASAYGDDAVYLLSDVTVSTRAKLSKLVAMVATSKTLLRRVEVRMVKRINTVITTARSKNPVSMKYRGIYELLSRKPSDNPNEGNILQYGSKGRDLTPQECFKWWWDKYGAKELGKKAPAQKTGNSQKQQPKPAA